MTDGLAGVRALITGASRGLGKAITQHFLQSSASVFLTALHEEDLQRCGTELLRAYPAGQAAWRAADASDPRAVSTIVDEARQSMGNIDALVCNAGIQGPIGPVDRVEWSDWIRTVEVNLFGTVLFCQAVIPIMRQAGAGRIVAISGGGATSPRPGFSAYAASKTAVVRFIETLSAELAGAGIEANTVAPGALNTRMLDETLAAGPERIGAAAYEAALRQEATGGASLAAAAELVGFLASNQSRGISGR
ncbi:MAG TPA: SDR family oxidoreductase, partial [Chloroflexota bacterium]|nr:SDR family oxidoreductase [Chloroflexota bacterium]